MEFLLIAAAHFLALLSPGPDFFLLMQAALRLPLRYCFAICCGIALANGLYLFVAVLGLELVRQADGLLLVLRYLGAIYLIFIGVMLLRSDNRSLTNQGSGSLMQVENIKAQFSIGFLSAILNPKNAIFYLSLFTVMVSVETSFTLRCLYALWMSSVVLIWDCGLVLFIGRGRVKKWLGKSVFYLEKLSGLALACFGLILPFT